VLYILSIASVLSHGNEVTVMDPAELDLRAIERTYPADLDRVRIERLRTRSGFPLVRECAQAVFNRRHDVIIVQSTLVPPVRRLGRAFLVCEFPFQQQISWRNRLRLKTYHLVANSRFTAGWIKRRWGEDAEVLHPPVFTVRPLAKEPWILGVGRFVDSIRSKRQLEMIDMFRTLIGAGLKGWSLHLAGTIGNDGYARAATEAAKGLPVTLHFGAPRQDLEVLYGKSSIFWHATGAGVNQESHPDLMEHFGISTAEAMSAGCVPVVVNGGGQPEIVGNECGVLWDTFDQCVERTLALAGDADRMSRLSAVAVERARLFSFPVFAKRVERIFLQCGSCS